MNNNKYRKDIDALRGLSILLVVLFHAFPEWIPGGFIGVDVFFVISGYLITTIIYKEMINNDFSFIHFYERRIRRIFPALFFVLIITLITGWYFLFPDEYEQLGRHVFFSSIFFQNFALIDELGYFDKSSHYKPLLHLWTLSIEEQYYLFWPMLLFVILQSRFDAFKTIFLIILSSFFINIYYSSNYTDTVFFCSFTRFWEIGIGSLLAIYLIDNKKMPWERDSKTEKFIFILGVTLILSAALFIDGETIYPYWFALIPTVGAGLIIAAHQSLLRWGGLVQVGLISYPLYLWHWVVISFGYIYLGKKPDNTQLLMLITFSFIISYLTMKYVEKIRYSKMRIMASVLIVVAVVVGFGGYNIWKNTGFASRSHLSYLDNYKLLFDRTSPLDGACENYVKARITKQRQFYYCRSNHINKNKMIVIIGDSHAHALYPGVAKAAEKFGYGTILLANTGCPTLIGFEWGENLDEISKCKESIDQIFEIISRDTRFEKVIFTTRGPTYIHGDVNGRFSNDSVLSSLNNFQKPDRLTYETYFTGIKNSLSQLENMTHVKNIFYYLENPELDFLPKEVVPRPYDIWGISIKKNVVDRRLYKMRMQKYMDMVYKASYKFKKTTIIDVTPYFCGELECYIYKDGNFLYSDDDHLSIYGSHYIVNKTIDKIF
jgi:peptidoglycan/LPS O-acetylase OafA/YrhL